MNGVYRKYLVKDDEGQSLRSFYTKSEAVAFLLPGYTIERLPDPPKIDYAALVGDALF
jgi:hypothetical protein